MRLPEGNTSAREKGWSNTRRVRARSSAVLDPEHVRNHLARELGGLMVDCDARWAPWSAM